MKRLFKHPVPAPSSETVQLVLMALEHGQFESIGLGLLTLWYKGAHFLIAGHRGVLMACDIDGEPVPESVRGYHKISPAFDVRYAQELKAHNERLAHRADANAQKILGRDA